MSVRSTFSSRRHFIRNLSLAAAGLPLGTVFSCKSTALTKASWRPKAQLPYQLQEIYCATLAKKIHVAGGFLVENGQVNVSDHHLIYDPQQDQWAEASQLPAARHHLQLVASGGKLYGMGGFASKEGQDNWIMHQQTWRYEPNEQQWSVHSPAPEPHGESVAACLGDFIHIVGGRRPKGGDNSRYQDHKDSKSHLVYHPDVDKWSHAAPAPTARNSAAGAVIDRLLYVVGGRTVNGGNSPNLEIYDPSEDKWRSAAPMPQGQGGLAAATVNGNLYAFGGEYFNEGGGVYAKTWKYRPKKDQWSTIAPMLTPRHGLAGSAIGPTIFAIGGAKQASLAQTSNLLEAIRL